MKRIIIGAAIVASTMVWTLESPNAIPALDITHVQVHSAQPIQLPYTPTPTPVATQLQPMPQSGPRVSYAMTPTPTPIIIEIAEEPAPTPKPSRRPTIVDVPAQRPHMYVSRQHSIAGLQPMLTAFRRMQALTQSGLNYSRYMAELGELNVAVQDFNRSNSGAFTELAKDAYQCYSWAGMEWGDHIRFDRDEDESTLLELDRLYQGEVLRDLGRQYVPGVGCSTDALIQTMWHLAGRRINELEARAE